MKIETIKNWFVNDWILIETFSEDFGSVFTLNGAEQGDPILKTSYYNIEYSKVRNKVRMKKKNSNRVTKKAYQNALNYMTALNIDLMKGDDINEILSKI